MGCEIEVGLTLTGLHVSPDDITGIVGLCPTRTWALGDSIQNTALRRKHDGWQFALPPKETLQLEEQLKDLLDALDPYRERIREVAQRMVLEVEVYCAVYIAGDTPASYLSACTLGRLVALGANLDIDLILTA